MISREASLLMTGQSIESSEISVHLRMPSIPVNSGLRKKLSGHVSSGARLSSAICRSTRPAGSNSRNCGSASAHDVFQSRKQTSNDVTREGCSRGCGAFTAAQELASGLLSTRATY
jgi:hypothetical protein